MEITIVVCDHCGARHEINPETEPHGHGPYGGNRLPLGWSHIRVSRMPTGDEGEGLPEETEFTEGTRELAVTQLRNVADTIANGAITSAQSKLMLDSFVRQLRDVGIGGSDPHFARRHGEHLHAEEFGGTYCPDCNPQVVKANGGDLRLIPQGFVGGTIMAQRI